MHALNSTLNITMIINETQRHAKGLIAYHRDFLQHVAKVR